MEDVLKKLQKCNFISGIHDKLLTAEAIKFVESSGLEIKPIFETLCSKEKSKEDISYLDSFVKFNLMATGLSQYLKRLEDLELDDEELMINCNIDSVILLVIYKNKSSKKEVVSVNFHEFGLLPIHNTTVDLDYNNKVHILLYNKKLRFPELILS